MAKKSDTPLYYLDDSDGLESLDVHMYQVIPIACDGESYGLYIATFGEKYLKGKTRVLVVNDKTPYTITVLQIDPLEILEGPKLPRDIFVRVSQFLKANEKVIKKFWSEEHKMSNRELYAALDRKKI